MNAEFEGFPKMARLSRDVVITEKLDGTNAQILIEEVVPPIEEHPSDRIEKGWVYCPVNEDGKQFRLRPGSRNRWITPGSDNYGFASWVCHNAKVLSLLGVGRHFGEWWGSGIQRRYGLNEKRFSLFNSHRWAFLNEVTPEQNPLAGLVGVVPVLYSGPFSTEIVEAVLDDLRSNGSVAAPGFMNPEGIVAYHTAAQFYFKKTLDNDAVPKSLVTPNEGNTTQ